MIGLLQSFNGTVVYCSMSAEKTPPVVTLYADDYLSYDLSRKADTIVSNSDSTSLYFKTRQSEAILFYTGTHSSAILPVVVN